jgi:hypothetical protein
MCVNSRFRVLGEGRLERKGRGGGTKVDACRITCTLGPKQ